MTGATAVADARSRIGSRSLQLLPNLRQQMEDSAADLTSRGPPMERPLPHLRRAPADELYTVRVERLSRCGQPKGGSAALRDIQREASDSQRPRRWFLAPRSPSVLLATPSNLEDFDCRGFFRVAVCGQRAT